ncbi:hypothetical protein A0256_13050 [Mucilaginibacter sp. PAMC 26640]|nr:hypothetical protein A0256_13050 [Mucilaginibacter sp. PAMC 26640]
MGKSRFIDLMARSMEKTATAEELAELQAFCSQHPNYKQLYDTTNSLQGADAAADLIQTPAEKIEKLWDHINNDGKVVARRFTPLKIKSLIKWQWAAVAATVLLGGVCTMFYIRQSKLIASPGMAMHKVVVPYGQTRNLKMPDGTGITLNAGSTLVYPDIFAGKTREVTLTGEGFFRVIKNPGKPFLVHTAKLTVTVLGTVFNVKAYNNDKTTETTLLRGKVQVDLNNNPEKKIILMPNEKLIVANDRSNPGANKQASKFAYVEYQVTSLPLVKPEDIKETAWLEKRIVFTNEPFEDVAKQIERKYDVQLIFNDVALKNEQISGLLDKESLPNALQLIELTTPFNYKIEGNVVNLSKK